MSVIQEQMPESGHEGYLDEVFSSRPELPIGEWDLSGYEQYFQDASDQEPGYAWERMPRYLTEIKAAFKAPSKIPIVHLDLGSSLPLNAEMMRALEFKRSGERARDLSGALFAASPGDALQDVRYNLINQIMARATTRGLVNSAIQKVLYTKNSYDEGDGNQELAAERMFERLYEVLASQDEVYDTERGSANVEEMWQIRFYADKKPQTYFEYLAHTPFRSQASLMASNRIKNRSEGTEINPDDVAAARQTKELGPERARLYLAWQAKELAKMISGNPRHRIARFISMDQTAPEDIARSSLGNTPESTRNLHLFSRAITSLFNKQQHSTGSIFEPLPVPDNSVALITCYDAWPLYSSFNGMTDDDRAAARYAAVEIIMGWYQKLAYSGKIVIFPWAVQGDPHALDGISAQLSLLMGHAVNRSEFHHAMLEDVMSESDKVTAKELSGVFSANGESIEALIIEKPARKLVERHIKTLGSRMLIAANAQEQRDPTP